MTAYFPKSYPDELLYSVLARYYTCEGYLAYRYAAEDLFLSRTVRPDMEFVNKYTQWAYMMITRYMPMEQVIMKSTMFPYYGRFLPKERRTKAFKALVGMEGNYHNLLPIPKNMTGKVRHLRYCPLCADEDRKEYGETYWHRAHQMRGYNACHIHNCRIADSSIIISGKTAPCLTSAEQVIPLSEKVIKADEIECNVSRYMYDVFKSDIDMDSDILAGDYLHSEMSGTKYRSVRGEQRNISLLCSDMAEYYNNLKEYTLDETWKIQKILTNDKTGFNEVCLTAMFLGIRAYELVNMKLPEKSQQQLFDERVYALHEQGMKYPEIAKRLNAPYDTVKSIGKRRYGSYHKPYKVPMKSGVKAKNWKQADIDMLPAVKKAIEKLKGDGMNRPRKVSVFAVERILDIPHKTISLYLPLCLCEIRKHKESQEKYWAREVVWAACRLMDTETAISWRKIRDIINLRHRDFVRCFPYLEEFTDKRMADIIRGLV